MAYLALARKWRPKVFSEVVGQSHVVRALTNALDNNRVHHAFLFTGTRGVGKTTLARIFAKSLNCEQGTSAEPCQQCGTCLSIDEGRFVDLIEVDAASRTKVDDTRELLENVQYAPTSGKYKVYLIDEVHMLSGHSFNALLKTLEEPPEHVKFLFATTDPQKLPVTVVSRCLQFNLRAMRPEQIENQLLKILSSENIESEHAAIVAIAKAADGSMRDGLSLLDQAIAQGAGTVNTAEVQNMLGTIKSEHSEALLQALKAQDADAVMRVVDDMADHAVDFSMALDELLVQLYNISLAQIAPNAIAAKDVNVELIKSLSDDLSAELVQLYYQIGLIAKRDLPLAPNLRIGFEMALLRMLAFEPSFGDPNSKVVVPATTDSIATGHTEQRPAKVAPVADGPSMLSTEPESLNVAATPNTAMHSAPPAPPQDSFRQASAQPSETVRRATSPAADSAPQTSNQAAPSQIAVVLAGNNEWGELIEQSNLIGLSKELAMNCACERLADDVIQLSLAPKSEHLFKPERLSDIENEIRAVRSSQVEVRLEVEDSDRETPAECLQRLGFEQHEQTRETLQNDPGVKELMDQFGAKINENSIKPLG